MEFVLPEMYLEDFLPGGYWWHNTIGFMLASAIFLGSLYLKYLQMREIWRLKDMLEEYPSYADLRCRLAELYLERGNLEEAICYYEEAVEIYPLFTKALLRLGELYELTGKPDKASDHYRVLFKSLPEDEPLKNEIRRKLQRLR